MDPETRTAKQKGETPGPTFLYGPRSFYIKADGGFFNHERERNIKESKTQAY